MFGQGSSHCSTALLFLLAKYFERPAQPAVAEMVSKEGGITSLLLMLKYRNPVHRF